MMSFDKLAYHPARCIIINPRYLMRPYLIGSIQAAFPLRYIAFRGTNLNFQEAQQQFGTLVTLSEQASTSWVVLDESDCLQTDALVMLVQSLMAQKDVAKVVVMGRRLSVELLTSSFASEVGVYPFNEMLLYPDYTEKTDKTLIEVHALGTGRIVIDGKLMDWWDGWLPRMLFHFFVDKAMVTRLEVFSTLWPGLTEREATNVYHVTKRKVNETLGFDLVEYSSGYYCLSPNVKVLYDVMMFHKFVQQAQVLPIDNAIVELNRAVDLYRADFMSGYETNWVLMRRAQIRQDYIEALVHGVEICEQLGDHETALRYRTVSEQLINTTETVF